MPAIWNIGNVSEASNKKVSSKLTFEVGESFKGRIVSKGEGNEVVVKLSDGWQFTAEIEGKVSPNEEGLIKFEVEDFEDGKIKLKIMPNQQTNQGSEGNIIGDFMKKTGMTKESLDILKAMVKYNIPLTKENITFIKSITAFNEKINSNPAEIDNFINKFISGKGIEEGSTKGQQIKDILNDFFKSFKTVSKDDILFFIENDIDINKENIDSYNKLFKSEGTIKEYFDNISKALKDLNIDLTDAKTQDSNSTEKGKVNLLSILKSVAGESGDIVKESVKEVLVENKNKFTTNEFKDKFLKLSALSEKELIDLVKSNLGNKSNITNKDIKTLISNILGKEIDIPEAGLQKIKAAITSQMAAEVIPVKEGEVAKESIKEVLVENKSKFTTSEFNDKFLKLSALSEKELINRVKTNLGKESNITNKDIKTLISNIIGKNIDIPDAGIQKIKAAITSQIAAEAVPVKEGEVDPRRNVIKSIIANAELNFVENDIDISKENIGSFDKILKSGETVKEYINNLSKSLKDLNLDIKDLETILKNNEEESIPKAILSSEEKASLDSKDLASKIYNSNSTDKGKVSMLSLLKSMVGEDVEVTKETIKEVLVQNKNEFTTSEFNDKFLKLNSLSEKELMDVVRSSFGNKENITNNDIKTLISNILGKEIDIPEAQLQKIKDIITFQMKGEIVPENDAAIPTAKGSILEENAKSIISELNIKGADNEIKNSITKEILNLSSNEIIREDIKVKIENMKDIIKDIIAHAQLKGDGMEKVMQFIKGNISDFKLLNSVNNEYYYLDVPIKNNGEEYPCKLIIKDSRKDNKKIDKTNVKMIVAVRTINLGTVDGYLKVNGTNLNVNIKCDDEFVKVIDKTKEKLLEGLKNLGFFTSITVTPKISEISLTTCRGFFEESHDRAIDTKV
ncbi:hypothetical protein [Clostridium vincentii]|uniref:Flagellar hook-length control protein FliK n=1 Tax=Clostridium vincentii TaxID=52704 RepID=A0A2T0BGJ8_9CLOT|nr:hypothetical protein [Clostridium vincentii]PRR83030.1 hypothetical protein CLVI_12790 [Clostridium vincentii]